MYFFYDVLVRTCIFGLTNIPLMDDVSSLKLKLCSLYLGYAIEIEPDLARSVNSVNIRQLHVFFLYLTNSSKSYEIRSNER